jgi:Glycosyltransferase family 87
MNLFATRSNSRSRYLALLCLFVAVVAFLTRGPLRTLRYGDFTDFTVTYVAARHWSQGSNPYQPDHFMTTWVDAGGERFVDRGSEANLRPAYPPSALPILAPFAIFRWPLARDLFLFSAVALFPLLLWFVLQMEHQQWNSNVGLVCCAFALALSPWHAAIAWQSISAQVIELAIIGTLVRSDVGGGLVTGLALCLKPQLVVWFLIFDMTKIRWKRVAWAITLAGVIFMVALARMPNGWLDSYRENLRYFFAVGDVNDFTLRNRVRFELLNLQVIFYFLTRNYQLANILSWLSTASLVVLWFRKRHLSDSAQLTAIVLIGLLPVYQRIYNAGAVLLILPYAISRRAEISGKLLIAECGVFLIPGTAILQTLWTHHWISDAVWNQSWWFNLIVGPHATWALLTIIAILLLWQKGQFASANEGRPEVLSDAAKC